MSWSEMEFKGTNFEEIKSNFVSPGKDLSV